MSHLKEVYEYRRFTGPAELHKAVNTLRGIVAGITTDRKATREEIDELANWCAVHNHLAHKHPFSELIPMIENIYEDGIITDEEAADLVWLCNNFISDSNYYDLMTSSIQFLFGLIHGILADGEITDDEIHSLKQWIVANEFLTGVYPFDEIESLLMSILVDGTVTEEERNTLKAYFSTFIDLTTSYNLSEVEMKELRESCNIGEICAMCQEMDFESTTFCFTGASEKATRNEIAEIITSLGGKFKNNITNETRYLVVGMKGNPCWAFSCYGRKVEDAIERRKKGQKLTIVSEVDFWDIIEDLE